MPDNLLIYMKKKARSLLIPYFVIGLTYCVLDGFLSGKSALLNGLKGVFITTTYNMPIESALWFLPALLWTTLMYAVIDKAMIKNKTVLIILITFVGCTWTKYIHYLPWGINSAMSALGFFAFGHWFRSNGEEKFGKVSEAIGKKCIGFFIWVALIALTAVLIMMNDNLNIRTGTFGILALGYTCAVVYCVLLFIMARWIDHSGIDFILAGIGSTSIIYVCTNHPSLKVARKVLTLCGFVAGSAIEMVLEFTIAILLMHVLAWIARKTRVKYIFGWR